MEVRVRDNQAKLTFPVYIRLVLISTFFALTMASWQIKLIILQKLTRRQLRQPAWHLCQPCCLQWTQWANFSRPCFSSQLLVKFLHWYYNTFKGIPLHIIALRDLQPPFNIQILINNPVVLPSFFLSRSSADDTSKILRHVKNWYDVTTWHPKTTSLPVTRARKPRFAQSNFSLSLSYSDSCAQLIKNIKV